MSLMEKNDYWLDQLLKRFGEIKRRIILAVIVSLLITQ